MVCPANNFICPRSIKDLLGLSGGADGGLATNRNFALAFSQKNVYLTSLLFLWHHNFVLFFVKTKAVIIINDGQTNGIKIGDAIDGPNN